MASPIRPDWGAHIKIIELIYKNRKHHAIETPQIQIIRIESKRVLAMGFGGLNPLSIDYSNYNVNFGTSFHTGSISLRSPKSHK